MISLMAACSTPGPRAGTDDIARAAGPQRDVIHASATYLEKIRMPADSVLSVRLLDLDRPADSAEAILAEAAFERLPGPPYRFVLPYPPERIQADGRYGLQATLTTPQGDTVFDTPAPVPVQPGQDAAPEVRMQRRTGP